MSGLDKKNSSRDALLKSAEKLFAEKGYNAVSTRELAESAGVNLGAIQYHFGSKAQLFIETIHSIMGGLNIEERLFPWKEPPNSKQDAAVKIFLFVQTFLKEMCHPPGPDVCRMMTREILSPASSNEEFRDALVSRVTEDFFRPFDQRVLHLLRLLSPSSTEKQLYLAAQSLYGQCNYYFSERDFIEAIRGADYTIDPYFSEVCRHISTFTLRGLRLSDQEIEQAYQSSLDQGSNI